MLLLGPGAEHELARGVEGAGHHDFAIAFQHGLFILRYSHLRSPFPGFAFAWLADPSGNRPDGRSWPRRSGGRARPNPPRPSMARLPTCRGAIAPPGPG